MQAFTEICPDIERTSDIPGKYHRSFSHRKMKFWFSDVQNPPSLDTSSRFTRELEERSQNGSSSSFLFPISWFFSLGNLSEQGKHAYDLLINRRISNSSSTYDEHSSVSSSSNPEKSDYRSRYSSISSLNSRSSSINKPELQPSITGQPLPPPPDLSSLGSKLTIATMTETFQLPKSLTLNKHRTKSRKRIRLIK